jgi:hypothetical protein
VKHPGSPSPRSFEVRLSSIAWGAGVLALALVIGTGAFVYGKSTGEDLEAARAAGAKAGHRKGAAEGATEGYAAGFGKGHKIGFGTAYPQAYRQSYAETFEEAGLQAPRAREIRVGTNP